MPIIIAVDIGGTQIRVATFRRGSTQPVEVRRTPTHSGEDAPFERLCASIAEVWPAHEPVETIVVATPGPLDPQTGMIFFAPNIAGWDNFPLRDKLHERFGVPTRIGNDANLAALGEWHLGAGRGHHHVLYLTISTGIGGGVISHDRLLEGVHGLATEVGHVTVLPDGPLCGCGQRGHLDNAGGCRNDLGGLALQSDARAAIWCCRDGGCGGHDLSD